MNLSLTGSQRLAQMKETHWSYVQLRIVETSFSFGPCSSPAYMLVPWRAAEPLTVTTHNIPIHSRKAM